MKKALLSLFIGSSLLFFGCSNTAINEPSLEDTENALYEYVDIIAEPTDKIISNLSDFQKLVAIGTDDVFNMVDKEYLDKVYTVSDNLHDTVEEARKLNIGNNSKIIEAHSYFEMALDELEFLSENYPDATRRMDIELMDKCIEAMVKSGEYIEKSGEKINSIKQSLNN